jgi:hypothetical protein
MSGETQIKISETTGNLKDEFYDFQSSMAKFANVVTAFIERYNKEVGYTTKDKNKGKLN